MFRALAQACSVAVGCIVFLAFSANAQPAEFATIKVSPERQLRLTVRGGNTVTLSTSLVVKSLLRDFSGDGSADAAIVIADSNIMRVKSFSSASGAAVSWSQPLGTGYLAAIVDGDFNGDGRADIAAVRFETPTAPALRVRVLLGPNGAQAQDWPLAVGNGLFMKVLSGDFNGDGRSDLAVVQLVDGVWRVRPYSDAQLGQPLPSWPIAEKFPLDVLAGDFNGDGIFEVAVIERLADGGIRFRVRSGPSGSELSNFTLSSQNAGLFQGFIAADLNGDGRTDIALQKRVGDENRLRVMSALGGMLIGEWLLPDGIITNILASDRLPQSTSSSSSSSSSSASSSSSTSSAGSSSSSSSSSGGGVSAPTVPQNVSASDGTSEDHVAITWSTVSDAASYEVYRAQFADSVGVSIGETSSAVFFDTSAVPGVRYQYRVRALNSGGASALSAPDEGFRVADGELDSDGDGVPDDQEIIDGTDPFDPGSFQLHLKSPAFTKYNTFLEQLNYLELAASTPRQINALVTVYGANGQPITAVNVAIPGLNQVDLDINALVGRRDTYGVVKIEWNDQDLSANIIGRMSNYRRDADGSYSFAFAKELRNPVRGASFATGNAFDPQGTGFLVPNWAEIVNLDAVSRAFDYKLFDQQGRLLQTRSVTVSALGEVDLQAGHEFGEGVYTAQFIPRDGATRYFAAITRYSSNAPAGQVAQKYFYAFPLDARMGTGEPLALPITNQKGACWTQTNWVEVMNVRENPADIQLTYRSANGTILNSTPFRLTPLTQYHFNGNGLLADGERGSVVIDSSLPGSIVAQSAVYYHDCSVNQLQSAYATPAMQAGQNVQVGSFNTFIGIESKLGILNLSVAPQPIQLELRAFGQQLSSLNGIYPASSATTLELNTSSVFNTSADQYGSLVLRSSAPKQFVAEVLRVREVNGRIDFAMTTAVK